jgi:flagellin
MIAEGQPASGAAIRPHHRRILRMTDVTLSNGMRSNLLSLKGVTELFDRTQERVSTRRKVNTPADDPLNYFQSSSLRSRASGLGRLLDGVALGVKTLEHANTGIQSIERLIESMQGLSGAARQSPQTNARLGSATDRDYRPGALGVLPTVASITSITITPTIPAGFTPASGFPAPAAFTVAIPVALADRVTGDATGRAAQSIAKAINAATGNLGPTVGGLVRPYVSAEVDSGGRFAIDNITGATDVPASSGTLRVQVAGGVLTDLFGSITPPTVAATATDTGVIGSSASKVRSSFAEQFRATVSQITNFAKDSEFNGINLLMGQSFDMIFTEDAASRLTVTGGRLDADNLGVFELDAAFNFQSNTEIDKALGALNDALTELKGQAAQFAGVLSVAKTREEFTKSSVKTLTIGADNLVLASVEEESANLLALQTRQQLSTQALSLAAQSEQAVLRLFG